jgi:hypothetical protein
VLNTLFREHCSEEDLVARYYDEDRRTGRVARHLERCADCRTAYANLSATLDLVAADEAPERGEQYGLEVWQRIRHRLPPREPAWWPNVFRSLEHRVMVMATVAALVAAAFVLGRAWPDNSTPAGPLPAPASPAARTAQQPDPAAALGLAVADHLERSERLLVDVMNTSSQRDLAAERQWAADLVSEGRLYRREVESSGDEVLASVLDELERNLLEIVHSPSPISPAALSDIRNRIDAAALLFKVRVLGDELREPPRGSSDPYVRPASIRKAG